MLTLDMFLNNYNNNIFLIRNADGDIIYPKSFQQLNKFNKIINSNTDLSGYYIFENQYYEFISQIIMQDNKLYVVETLQNVTRFEEETILANTDFVTNLSNKRLTFEMFNNCILKSIELELPFACVLGDADFFKKINDTYGHLCGDVALKSLGQILYKNTRHRFLKGKFPIRGTDIVGRIGGEEFLIVLNNVTIPTSYNIINKIRHQIEKSQIEYEEKIISSCTMSFGIHYVSEEELKIHKKDDTTIDQIRDSILKKCDDALYISKINGRNQINIFGVNSHEDLNELMYSRTLKKKTT